MTYEEITQLDIISLKYTDKHGIKDKMEKMEFVAATDLKYLLMAYDITNSMQRPIIIQNQLKEKITIYEHQIRAVSMVKNLFNGRVLLADEVGLGKTIEAGILIKEYFAIGLIHNALILTPPSLTQQWKEELGTKFELSFINHKDEEFEGPNQHNRLIMSLDTAKSDKNMKLLSSKEWDLVVVDEAHRIRNAKTKAHKAVAKLDTKYLFLLSATPMQNNLRELYNLVNLIKPGLFGTEKEFLETYATDPKNPRKIIPDNRSQLQELLQDVIIRTTRSEVRKEIQFTDRKPQSHIIESTKEEKKLYEESTEVVRQIWKSEGSKNVLPIMTLQRQISSSTNALRGAIYDKQEKHPTYKKNFYQILELARNIIEDSKMLTLKKIIHDNPSQKYLIFTEFRKTQDYIAEILGSDNIRTTKFNGGLTLREKIHAIKDFKENVQIMVSTESGGEGYNFQFCNAVINYDLPWNPMKVEQRVGRVHRIGQTHDVYIHNLAIIGTIEEHVLELLFNKINLFKMTIGDLDVLFEDENAFEKFEHEIFKAYIEGINKKDIENKFSAIGERFEEKRSLEDDIKDLDKEVFGRFNFSTRRAK